MQNLAPPRPLDSTGVKVLLALLAGLPLWRREGDTGLRITDRPDGSVLVEAVQPLDAHGAVLIAGASRAAHDAGLGVDRAELGESIFFSRVVRRSS